MQSTWIRVFVFIIVALAIGGAFKYYNREVINKEKMPIENKKPEWQPIGTSTMVFDGKEYPGTTYFDRMSIEKNEGTVSLWVKIEAPTRISMHKGKNFISWDEQIAKWNIDCRDKMVKVDYLGFYLKGEKQFSGIFDDINLPIMKDTPAFNLYNSFCF
jgi:hypothetical protein